MSRTKWALWHFLFSRFVAITFEHISSTVTCSLASHLHYHQDFGGFTILQCRLFELNFPMLVVCHELVVCRRIVVFQLFPGTKLEENVLQMIVVYIAGCNSRGLGLITTPQIINVSEFMSLWFLFPHVPQRILRNQSIWGCFMPSLILLCPTTSLVHWLSCAWATSNRPMLVPQVNVWAGLLLQHRISAAGCHGTEAESLSILCFWHLSCWHREARRERKYLH